MFSKHTGLIINVKLLAEILKGMHLHSIWSISISMNKPYATIVKELLDLALQMLY